MMQESKASDATALQQACYAEVYAVLGRPSEIVFKEAFNDQLAKYQSNK